MERGFDKLMTPGGINLVTVALFAFFLLIVIGGVAWRVMEANERAKRKEK